MRLRFLFFFACLLPLTPAFCQLNERYSLIPQPTHLEPRTGEFVVSRTTTLMVPFADTELKYQVDAFAHQLLMSSGINLPIRALNKESLPGNLIQFMPLRDTTMGQEGYYLDISPQLITVEAATPKGFFYAIQTLYQLLPPSVLSKEASAWNREAVMNSSAAPRALLPALSIPTCRIQDKPRYPYRGMHLDVSRHFFPVSFIKKYLDLMALHKFNTFHWHLTDDQGWRIEIKKYPKLTQIGSHRSETIIGHYDDYDPQIFDGKPYDGFYTQDEIRDVIRYAAARYITIVPEIELPGHALAALAAYPELGCSAKGGYTVATKWGVFDDVFCPTEKTFAFLDDVLTEVMELFPGRYIHIGGDECPKTVWHRNAFCQQLIKRLKLKNENGLQLYFVKRIDQFVTSKGRSIIGWDEILDGTSPTLQLSPNATVMSWRSVNSGIRAAQLHHNVIMTPGKFCYLDHYQGHPGQEPTAFGDFLPLSNVYSYDPTPASLSPEDATHILGAQGNVWTEYISTEQQAEYMIWPRAAALAEVGWTPLASKNYTDFLRRLRVHLERLTYLNTHYARTLYNAIPASRALPDGKVEVSLHTDESVPAIRYTLDGSIPSHESTLYTAPFLLAQTALVRTATFANGKPLVQLAQVAKEYLISKATGKSYTLLNTPTTGRPDKNFSLTDGNTGSVGGYEVDGVVSFRTDLNTVIDLGSTQEISQVRIGFLKYTAKNICLPRQVDISVSEDGKTFTPVFSTHTNAAEHGKRAIVRLPFDFKATNARYVRIIARNVGRVPAGLRYPGRTAQLALDEIEVH